jgi:alpha-galactosidase/6-phospho-beta-glucosidase family protein
MTKITVIGAGSASFGENTLAALLRSKKLRGSHLALVDKNPQSLEIVHRLALRLAGEWSSGMSVTAHVHHGDALADSDFVISAIEVSPREALWRQDFEIPLKYGVRQPYAENGGPGGFAHTLRNVPPLLAILRDMEQVCPQAWFINYTNPMVRICDAINRYSSIKVVGLCHQIRIGYCFVGLVLGHDLGFGVPEGITGMQADIPNHLLRERVITQAMARLDIRAAGTNHFSWILSIRDRETGEDLYPLFRERWASFDPTFEPLTRKVFEAFELFPVAGDTHLCEYLPWMSNPATRPWEKFGIRLYEWETFAELRNFRLDRLQSMAGGVIPIDALLETDSEGALELTETMACAGTHYHQAANLPNEGQISNLPAGSIVETPVLVDGEGVHPVHVGTLPEAIAEMCRRELAAARLCVDAAVTGDHRTALQCLLLDPVISDIYQAEQILDDYLTSYRQYLPQFFPEDASQSLVGGALRTPSSE